MDYEAQDLISRLVCVWCFVITFKLYVLLWSHLWFIGYHALPKAVDRGFEPDRVKLDN